MASAGDKPNKTMKVTSSEDYNSEGFDAPEDGPSIPGGIRPYEIVESEPRKIVKVNVQCVPGAPRVAGLMYYITFIGHIRLCGSATFRGKILKMVDGFLDVKFCDMVLEEESGTSQEPGTSKA
ncbi:uncharacterized protein LOC110275136 isoform X2 [Arachis duranensis]|uniref:Uncharacterized protein LOC110275136 isoform X2 n=1 Tax=Arachis duranensis TaxID=130453 RepID=A0A9C6WD17_ARADU|nr:uncharacterized protein LOC110275136 isoform X2 [Arachis duranensis]